MTTNEDDMEKAYQYVLFEINEEVIQYTLSLIQDAGLEVDSLRDFMKGYYVSKFSLILAHTHMASGNHPSQDNPIIFQEYLKKINSSEKLKNILNQLL